MKTDLELQKVVMEELQWQPTLKPSKIGVSVSNGVVTLSGMVDNYGQKRDAENAVLGVEGVKAIADDLEVSLHQENVRTDTEIAEAAINTLTWHSLVPKDKITVRVENGWITAEGKVSWIYEKNAVKNALSYLPGVKGITNLVTIVPGIDDGNVKRNIKAAFERNASIDANNIHVGHSGNKVILTGTVRSYAERHDAEKVAGNAPGVTQVDNQLEVKIPNYLS
ncbi:MAG: ornithine aminotransferase [Candidatus Fluviicola riflensis]|nr:MAG: ornithine aminotransferase [Candidatus Fluviicola riflensis]OGS77843.1 MAG: ornithine aminotransferase [Candidatus Fluviicola riflensis]OGS84908.1 MAG: ornithine aminotransferase [Fluviicola sp. RIFCSPHIGHO2_01_FULL_43_53]OGS89180.1 MAG: ornithine aminotransferase [Fluviicola sp. RIFCSPHIGHO2_12_FULL_43_24]